MEVRRRALNTRRRDDLDHSVRVLVVFSEAAQQGGFAAAARELGLSSSAVVKGIARLELSLRVRLFHRTARSIRLTQEGETQSGVEVFLEDIGRNVSGFGLHRDNAGEPCAGNPHARLKGGPTNAVVLACRDDSVGGVVPLEDTCAEV